MELERPTKVWTTLSSSLRLLQGLEAAAASECLLSRLILLKVFPQPEQLYFLVCRCVCRWALRLLLSAKLRAQKSQANGFSPVCVRTWPCRSQGREKLLPQVSHLQVKMRYVSDSQQCSYRNLVLQYQCFRHIVSSASNLEMCESM